MRRFGAILLILVAAHGTTVRGQSGPATPRPLLDVPFIPQSEALCGGAAAAMVLRFWGERDISADSFATLVDRSVAGIRTDALVGDLQRRGWDAVGVKGTDESLARELARGRPVIALIEDRRGVFHYVVLVARYESGVVFHDPARIPFRVMTVDEFARRWNAAGRWMAVISPRVPRDASVPSGGDTATPAETPAAALSTSCDALIAQGVDAARDNELAVAERALTAAFSCPGGAAARELAGVRLLQQRWDDVASLASAAIQQDARDTYAWKLLGTARFIQDDPTGALDAWNRAGEPRVDLVQFDGLARTRYAVVEHLLGVRAGDVLTTGEFIRARRRLRELPSTTSTRLAYRPVPGGRAELRGAIVERRLFPSSSFSLAALGLSAVAAREVRPAFGSFTGGGEEIVASWRFWPRRPRLGIEVRAPAPWGGIWGVEGYQERQAFTGVAVPEAQRAGGRLVQSYWISERLRLSAGVGLDRWRGRGTFTSLSGGAVLASRDDRFDMRAEARTWVGRGGFAVGGASARVRSSAEPRGWVWMATAAVELASAVAPLDLWPAGDTGSARSTLLRAHPVLGNGRMRIARLGQIIENVSVEGQRWWRVAGPVRAAAAGFIDAAHTSRRRSDDPLTDLDTGIGARFAAAGVPGTLRINFATGIDGATALSFIYVVE